jgi:cyanophycinase
VAREYLSWLQNLGVEAQILDVTAWNIETASRDRRLLKQLAAMGTLLFTGGDQRRLTETLLHCAEATPVWRTIVSAYEYGATLIGVGGSAAAFGTRMIAEGTSCEALRYGASEDAGYEGLVIEEGFGLVDFGLVDQNFLNRRRLGRLVVACAEEGYRYGFGICEETGMVIAGHSRTVRAFGRNGIVIANLDPGQVRVAPGKFAADGIELSFMEPGGSFDIERGTMTDGQLSNLGPATLAHAVSELARQCDTELGPDRVPAGDNWLHLNFLAGVPASLDIQSRRA